MIIELPLLVHISFQIWLFFLWTYTTLNVIRHKKELEIKTFGLFLLISSNFLYMVISNSVLEKPEIPRAEWYLFDSLVGITINHLIYLDSKTRKMFKFIIK